MAETALTEDNLQLLLEKMHTVKGWDFRQYRKSSLKRCIERRIAYSRLSCKDYMELLDSEPLEFNNLFNNITIKVSEFFRDPEVFRRIEEEVIPEVLQRLKANGDSSLRIWSCGCARGDEAYSIAILLSQRLGKTKENYKVEMFATDIDGAAVDIARTGTFHELSLKNVDQNLRSQYFQRSGYSFNVIPFIRNLLTFGVHDIVSNIHLSHMDIILCRNLLIYFEKDLQEKVFEKLYYSLKRSGFVILGRSETIPYIYKDKFREVFKKEKIYQKI